MFDNTVGSLDSLPVEIQEYYEEDIRTEPTGEMVSEEYTYTDDKGTKQTATRDVPEMQDITYIVQKPRGEVQYNVSYQLLNNRRIELVNKFLEMENNGIHWRFHDDFLSWLEQEPKEAERARSADGTFIADDPETEYAEHWIDGITPEMQSEAHSKWETSKPIKQPLKTLEDYPEYAKWKKLQGVEFEGVMCSATKEDYWGLAAAENWIRAGNNTLWEFDNGSKLLLTPENIDTFMSVWISFRAQFFS